MTVYPSMRPTIIHERSRDAPGSTRREVADKNYRRKHHQECEDEKSDFFANTFIHAHDYNPGANRDARNASMAKTSPRCIIGPMSARRRKGQGPTNSRGTESRNSPSLSTPSQLKKPLIAYHRTQGYDATEVDSSLRDKSDHAYDGNGAERIVNADGRTQPDGGYHDGGNRLDAAEQTRSHRPGISYTLHEKQIGEYSADKHDKGEKSPNPRRARTPHMSTGETSRLSPRIQEAWTDP